MQITGEGLWPFINFIMVENPLHSGISFTTTQQKLSRNASINVSESGKAASRADSYACIDGGSYSVEESTGTAGLRTSVLIFDQCLEYTRNENGLVIDFELLHGTLERKEVEFNQELYYSGLKFNYRNLQLQSLRHSYTIDGSEEVYGKPTCTVNDNIFNLSFRNNKTREVYKTGDLKFSGCDYLSSTIDGRLFHEDSGYIDITTNVPFQYDSQGDSFPENQAEIVFSGADDSLLRLRVIRSEIIDPTPPTSPDYEEVLFELSLDKDGDSYFESVFALPPEVFLTEQGSNLLDSDMDQVPDGYELWYGSDPYFDDANLDINQDGLTVLEHFRFQGHKNQMGILSDYLDALFLISMGDYSSEFFPKSTAGQTIVIPFEFKNFSLHLVSVNTLARISVDTFFYGRASTFTVSAEGCTSDGNNQLLCNLGDINPQEVITKNIHISLDEPGYAQVSASVESLDMAEDEYNTPHRVDAYFANREADLRVYLSQMNASYIDAPSISEIPVVHSSGDEARNPVIELTIPDNITVNSILFHDYQIVNGEVVKDDFLGYCEGFSQPNIRCLIPITLSDTQDINVQINHTGNALGFMSFSAQVSSDADRYIDPHHPDLQNWRAEHELVVASSLLPYQEQIDSAVDGDVITIPDGVYAGTLDLLGKDLIIQSENGYDHTTLWVLRGGISISNGGHISGFTFKTKVAGIGIILTGGLLELSNNYVDSYSYRWVSVENASLDMHDNIIYGRTPSIFSYYGLIELINPPTFNITNNLFIETGSSSGSMSGIIDYYQNDYLIETPLTLGVVGNNLFYNEESTNTIGLRVLSHRQIANVYLVNNIFYASAAFDDFNYVDLTSSNNLFYDPARESNDNFYEPGINWTIDIDPMFTNPDEMDFSLQPGSPAIDAGIDLHTPLFDFDGNPRIIDGDMDSTASPDIGPFEYLPN